MPTERPDISDDQSSIGSARWLSLNPAERPAASSSIRGRVASGSGRSETGPRWPRTTATGHARSNVHFSRHTWGSLTPISVAVSATVVSPINSLVSRINRFWSVLVMVIFSLIAGD